MCPLHLLVHAHVLLLPRYGWLTPSSTLVNKGAKRGREDRSGNVDGYRTGAMDCLGVSLSWGRRSRNAWPLAAKAGSWPPCHSWHTSKRRLAREGSSWTTGRS